MSQYIALEIPREVLHATRMTPDELRSELAVSLFQQGKLSFGKARELTGLSIWAFQQILGSRDIPIHYDENDFADDIRTLRDLDRL